MKHRNFTTPFLVVFIAILLPYVIAALVGGGGERVFAGFLFNPIDGASYLAKMYQGWLGSWRFTLPYTAEPGQGAYLFLFYLALGHLARLTGLSLIIVFHLARLAGAGLLLAALVGFYDRVFAGRPDLHRFVLWLTVIGSGMGWLILFLGATPADFTVAEAYPFLSMYSNPHFPLGLAALLRALTLLIDPTPRLRVARLAGLGLALAILQPFAVVVGLLVAGAWALWGWWETRRLEWQPVVGLGLLGGPFLLYQYAAILSDPVLAGWNAQNLTPAPPVYDFLLSFSPALVLAGFGVYCLLKGGPGGAARRTPAARLLVSWLVLGAVLLYLPFPLQRRFLLGYYVPAAALAGFGIDYLRSRFPGRARRLGGLALGLSLPTNLLLLLLGLFGALGGEELFYLTRDEASALEWLRRETPQHALVLASPEMGQFVPAMTGRRVLYGHPFETVDAEAQEARVEAFFAGQSRDALDGPAVDYLIYGPREWTLDDDPNPGTLLDLSVYPLVFESGEVQVYQVRQP